MRPTVESLLRNAVGDVEVIVVLDGYWPITKEAVPEDKRVVILHRGKAQGMRPAINSAVAISTGQWLMKIDAHCDVSHGYDESLKQYSHDETVMVPRRLSLDPFTWTLEQNGKSPVDAHYLSYPFEREGDRKCGLHGTVWNARARARKSFLIDNEMSSQGSCWFMSRRWWDHMGPMEVSKYGNFIQEFQELGLKTWLGGGTVLVNKYCSYSHWHKGKHGRGYFISRGEQDRGADFATRYWMTDSWKERVHDLKWLIELFAPVPGWPEDLDKCFADARKRLAA